MLKIYNTNIFKKEIKLNNNKKNIMAKNLRIALSAGAIIILLNTVPNITYAAESIEKMNEQTTEGEFLAKGMPTNEYQSTKNKTFKEVVSSGTYEDIDYDISKYYSYKDIDNFVENLTRHSMVKTYIAGYSEQGRKIYLLEVGTGSKTIILTGGVHARETAGPSYILKGLSDLVRKAETDENAKKILTNYKFIAIPCVNPDGREMVINGKYSLKANANYVDIGRNFPTSNAMQYKFGNGHSRYEEKPSYSHYCGPYLGSESETQAVMAVLNKYIPTASYLIDYHQSGKGVYGGKLYDEKNKASKSAHFRDAIRKHIGYSKINEEKELRGGGEGSLSDYATEVASGFIFSDFYGRLTYNGDPLLIYNDIDKHKEYYNPVNKNIKIVTLEIGSSSTRGYSSSTRQKQKEEYKKFDDLLQWIVKYDKKYGEPTKTISGTINHAIVKTLVKR